MSSPNVIPMADIMLVLLIIFMVVTPMLQKNKPVDMARTNTARDMQDADKEDAVVVAVTRDGNIFLGNTQVQKADLSGQVKDRISGKLDKTVYLKSDARAKYGDVVAIVDEIRSAGVDQLGLLTERNEKGGAPPPPPIQNPNGDLGSFCKAVLYHSLLEVVREVPMPRRLPLGAAQRLKSFAGMSRQETRNGDERRRK